MNIEKAREAIENILTFSRNTTANLHDQVIRQFAEEAKAALRPEFTPWFGAAEKPVRVGVYQRLCPSGTSRYALWDGRYWRVGSHRPDFAAEKRRRSAYQTHWPWRGAVEEGKA